MNTSNAPTAVKIQIGMQKNRKTFMLSSFKLKPRSLTYGGFHFAV